MCPAGLRPADRCPHLVGLANSQPTPVDVDLVVDELQVFSELIKLGDHVSAVSLQEG
jgi:hypothetical protein